MLAPKSNSSGHNGRFLLLALILLASDLLFAQGQIKSRKQQQEILRRDKVARLWPERQSQIVGLVNKYTEQGLFDDPSKGSNGFQPVVLGGMRADNGFTYGVGYRRSDLWRDRIGFRTTARATLAKSTLFDFYLDSPKLNRGRAFVDFYAKYENSPTMSYYGQGQDSLEENQTSYRLEDTDLTVTGGYRFTDWLSVALQAGGYFVHTGEGTREPSIDEKFPGLRQNVDYFRWGWAAQVDFRDNPGAPRRGGNYYVRFRQYSDRSGRRAHSFRRIVGFAEQYFPYHNDTRVVALRVEAMTAFSSDGQSVPFYLQPYLGGNNRLRGFEPYRFTDQTSFFAVAEHRWYVFSGLEAGVFAETGKVAPRNGVLNLSNLKWDGGVSLRFKLFDSFFMRVDNAFSTEGWRFIFTFTELFGRQDRW